MGADVMTLRSLGYVGIECDDLDLWISYAKEMLGMEIAESCSSGLKLRMDERAQRVMIDRGERNGLRYCGWEVENEAALDEMASRVEAWGVAVSKEPAAVAMRRGVRNLISFLDPVGNRVEIFHGAELADVPFTPGRAISGFRTGPLGLGHIVLNVANIEAVMPFYCEALGFRLSDYALRPFKAFFFHINNRHHSFALVETGISGVHHLMVELMALDDVGQGYDLAQLHPHAIGVTLGRHSNDLMTSFYMNSPAGFLIEYGWGGRSIDPEKWRPFEYTFGPSLWGHERSWLAPGDQVRARSLRIAAAAAGIRERVHGPDGSFVPNDGAADSLDSGTESKIAADMFRDKHLADVFR